MSCNGYEWFVLRVHMSCFPHHFAFYFQVLLLFSTYVSKEREEIDVYFYVLFLLVCLWIWSFKEILLCFIQKALFLEEWFKVLQFSLGETSTEPEAGNSIENQKKQMISKAIQSLIQVYESRNHHATAQKFEKLTNNIQWMIQFLFAWLVIFSLLDLNN